MLLVSVCCLAEDCARRRSFCAWHITLPPSIAGGPRLRPARGTLSHRAGVHFVVQHRVSGHPPYGLNTHLRSNSDSLPGTTSWRSSRPPPLPPPVPGIRDGPAMGRTPAPTDARHAAHNSQEGLRKCCRRQSTSGFDEAQVKDGSGGRDSSSHGDPDLERMNVCGPAQALTLRSH